MYSRYSLMKESDQVDTDGENWPDPLSVNYSNFKFTSIPSQIEINTKYIDKFWTLMYDKYGLSDHDDILLSLNGIPFIGKLEPGDIILKISQDDLENFVTNQSDEDK